MTEPRLAEGLAADSSRARRKARMIALALGLLTFAVYAQVIGHQFISLDDDVYITENRMVHGGLTRASILWAFTTFHSANWHPLTWISHMIDCQLFGLRAGGHLLVNTLIHVANTVLVFRLLARTTRAQWRSAIVAALFALHPLHVESVAWAAERKDTLATLFGLLSLLAYASYAKAPSTRRYLWVATLLAVGLMAKPMLVTWPFVMLLMDYWPLRRVEFGADARTLRDRWLRLVTEKLPLFGIVAASAVITYIAQAQGGAVRTVEHIPLWFRFSNAVIAYAKYVALTFWPQDLAVYYPFTTAAIPLLHLVAAILLLVAVTAFCFLHRKVRPYLLVGWLWFVGTLVPVIGLVQVGAQTMADRYHYIPSIGLFAAVVFGVAELTTVWRWSAAAKAVLAGLPLAVLLPITSLQIHRWRDSITLFEHTLKVTPSNLLIEYNYGLVLARSGRLEEAASRFSRALEIQPTYYNALVNLGVTRAQQGRMEEAVAYFKRAITSDPNSPKAYVQLGLAYANQNRDEAALEQLQRALALAPADAAARANFGLVLLRLGRIEQARNELTEAVRLDPQNADTRTNLGAALMAAGRFDESVAELETALRLNPNLEVAAQNLRRARAEQQFRR